MGQIADGLLADDDGAVRAALGQELTRLRAAEPNAALAISPDASVDEARARFLALAKIYHPNRFARRPQDVVKLANEVFLLLRRAYQRFERTQQMPAAEAVGPSPAAGAVSARAAELSPPSQPKLDVDIALARRRRARSKPMTGVLGGTPPPPTAPEPAERPRRREGEKERFDAAMVELRSGRLPSARAALRVLADDNPSDLQFRAYLHYVTGRMHEAAGRGGDALVEYERALGFDPDFGMARKAKDKLAAGSERTGERDGSGRFSRWFRK